MRFDMKAQGCLADVGVAKSITFPVYLTVSVETLMASCQCTSKYTN